MNYLLCLSAAVLLILIQGTTSQLNKEKSSSTVAKSTAADGDLCNHPFHSFLCNPSKSGHKRRIYNGQKPGAPVPPNSNQLTGENSFLQSTQLRPDLPKQKPVNEPKLKPDTSNIDSVFQAPGYLPPNSEKPSTNLFGDNSFLDPTQLLPPTTKSPRKQPTRPTTTTARITTQRATTPRAATTAKPTTRAPITTKRTTTLRTTTEPNLQPESAQNTGTRIRPDSVKPVKEDLCAHAFHSFLCDTPKPTRPRRIYNGQKPSPENTNILGENSFQQSSRVLPPTKPSPKPLPSTTTYKPVPRPTTTTTTAKPVKNKNVIGDGSYLSPTYLKITTTKAPIRTSPIPTTPKPTRRPIVVKPKPEPEIQPDAAQSPSVRIRPDATKNVEKEDLCKHAFHSFLCDTPKPAKARRIYNGQNPSAENSNILGENSFQQPSRILAPTSQSPKPLASTTPAYKPTPVRHSTIRTTTKPTQNQNIISDNSYLSPSKLLPTTTRAPVRKTPIPTTPNPFRKPAIDKPEPEQDIQPDGAQNPSVRLRPDASEISGKEDLCKHSFHSFLCSGAKSTGKRRNYNGQVPNVLGANSFVNSRSLLPPQPKRTETPLPLNENEFQQTVNAASISYLPPVPYLPPVQLKRVVRQNTFGGDSENIISPISKPIPASLARGNPPTTLRPIDLEADVEGAAADAPSVIVPPADHHHDHSHDATDHHHDAADHHHDATGHGHDHAHGDHHHHHHNITLEQLCRDPFHAFLCLNVDTSKRRIYDGNPAQGSPSEQDTLQALSRSQLQAASSVRQLRKIHSPPNIQSPNDIPQLLPSSFVQENNAQFRFQANEPIVKSSSTAPTSQYVSISTQDETTPFLKYTSTEPTRTQSATSSFLQNVREQAFKSGSNTNDKVENNHGIPDITSHEITESPKVADVVLKPVDTNYSQQPEVVSDSPRPRGSVRRTSQRKPSLSEPSPTLDTLTQQPIYRQRRPLRRKQQTTYSDASQVNANNDESYVRPRESQNIPENVNRRSDLGSQTDQEQPKKRKFGAKIPRRRRLPQADREISTEISEPISPSKFVRGPRGIASDLAATNNSPDIPCSEPFNAYQCNPKIIQLREKRAVHDDEEVPRRQGNMRGQAQGQETEQVKKDEPHGVLETRKERIRQKLKAKIEEQAKVEEKVEQKDEIETISSTTEDPLVTYQKSIDEELKLRELEENNRKEELKRRDDDLKNRREELKRREKEQEGRKEEDKRRKEEMSRRKVEDEKRKLELKRIKDEDKSDDDEEENGDDTEDDEEKKEEEEKDKLLTNYEKGLKADLKLREAEVKRREEEVERREKELIRREVEEKRRLMEAERRRVQDKRIEEELERQRLQKIRVAEELVRRQEEDDRRSAAKLKAESN